MKDADDFINARNDLKMLLAEAEALEGTLEAPALPYCAQYVDQILRAGLPPGASLPSYIPQWDDAESTDAADMAEWEKEKLELTEQLKDAKDGLRDIFSTFREERCRLEEQLALQERHRQEHLASLEKLEEKLDHAQNARLLLLEEMGRLEHELQSSQRAGEETRGREEGLQRKLADMNIQVKGLNVSVESLKKDYETSRRHGIELEEQIKKMREQEREMHLIRERSESQAKALTMERERLLSEVESLREREKRAADRGQFSAPEIEPTLDPAWERVVRALKSPVERSYAHLRRMAAGKLSVKQRGLLRVFAGELAYVEDQLTILEQYLSSGGGAEAGAVELIVDEVVSAWEPACRRKNIQCVRRFEGALPASLFEAQRLRVALHQIVRNAFEAMPGGGCLTITVSRSNDSVVVRFTDMGKGFSEKALNEMFLPFSSQGPGHLGIGLPLVRRTMEGFGGTIDAGNNESGGAFVSLRFNTERSDSLPRLGADPFRKE